MHPSTSFHSTPNRHFHQASPSDTNNNSLPAASTQPLPTALPNRLSAMEERKTAIDTDRKPGAPSHCSLGPSRYPLAEAATPPSLKPCRIPMAPWQSSPSSCSGKEYPYTTSKRRSPSLEPAVCDIGSSSLATPSCSLGGGSNGHAKRPRTEPFVEDSREAGAGAYIIDRYAIPSPSYPALPSEEEVEDDEHECSVVADTLRQLPSMVQAYDSLPNDIKSYVLFQLLKLSPISTLQFVSSVIVPALKRDFLECLPLELSLHVVSYLDAPSLCSAACVSRKWKSIIDSDANTWKRLLDKDGFKYVDPWSNRDHSSLGKSGTLQYRDDHSSTENMDIDLKPVVAEPSHPYKDIYRRHYTLRRNWREGRARRITFQGHRGHVVTCLQFDDNKIVSGADDGLINVYDTRTGSLKHSLRGHDGGVWALQYVNNTLVSGATDRTVRVWNIARGVCTHVFAGHTSTVRCLQIVMPKLVDGRMEPSIPLIVTGSRDSTIRVWRLPDPERDERFRGNGVNPWFMHTLAGHSQSVRTLAAHGNRLVSGSYDNTVCIWDIEQGRLLHRMEGHTQKVYSVVIDPERRRCMSGSMDATVRIWDMETGNCLKILLGHSVLVGLLGLTPNYLVSAAADASLRIWSPESGTCQHVLNGHRAAITCFQHSDDIIISGSEGGLKMWDVRTGRLVRDLITDVSGVWRVAFDRRRCVAAVHKGAETMFEVLDFGVHGLEHDGDYI